jgi:hypothetical protein
MGVQEGAKTLINREETHGRTFPSHFEKIGLILSILLAVFIGQWMWNESGWLEWIMWAVTLCGLPIGILLLSEMLARITQKIHSKGGN